MSFIFFDFIQKFEENVKIIIGAFNLEINKQINKIYYLKFEIPIGGIFIRYTFFLSQYTHTYRRVFVNVP